MKILVVAYNLFKNVGGGETVYQRIINSLKDFDFTYLTDDMNNEGAHPANAHPVLVPPGKTVFVEGNPGFPQYILGQLREADRVAQAVAGQEFVAHLYCTALQRDGVVDHAGCYAPSSA